MRERLSYPGAARFAFTVIDDTDVATVANVEPVYRLLASLGMRTTKTVWPLSCPEGSPDYQGSETLEDAEYLSFVRSLVSDGFEVTWHGATMESSLRERTVRGLEAFRVALGHDPRIHVNHSYNRENLYWGVDRLDDPVIRRAFGRLGDRPGGFYQGHVPGTDYWWGDLAQAHCTYARNLTFNRINLLSINPTLPYQDPRRPLIPWWFSASDAEEVDAFNRLLAPANQRRLEDEGGICIVATHFGKRFVQDGEVHPETRRLLERLASRPGWFPPVGELLDWLREIRAPGPLPRAEWRRMQWRWAWDLMARKWRERRSRRSLG